MPESEETPEPRRPVHHPGMVLLTFAAACACLLLGWWQWNRFHGSGGSFQNLGYALQWPLFAVFTVYGYTRFAGLVRESRTGRDVSTASRVSTAMPPLPEPASVNGLVGPRHRGLSAYNSMLAELAERTTTAERNSQ